MPFFPQQIDKARLLRWSRSGTFPGHVKVAGERSEPVFLREAVMAWARSRYGEFFPANIMALEANGFGESPAPMKRKKRK